MELNGIDAGAAAVQAAKQIKPQKKGAELEPSQPDTAELPKSESHGGGVIELLKAGHFKVTADVRLRINFFDELQALENQGLKNSAEAGFQEFNQSIEEPISLLEESGELTEEQLGSINQFMENIHEIQNDFLQGDAFPVGNIINNLQTEFDTLLPLFTPAASQAPEESEETEAEPQTPEATDTGAPAIQAPQVPETKADDEVPSSEQTETPPENSLSDIFTSFQEVFQQAMGDLQASLSGSQVLPEISVPSGNGKAFEKFMSIYENMKHSNSNDPPLIDEQETG